MKEKISNLESNLKEWFRNWFITAVELSLEFRNWIDVEISDEELAALVTVEDIVKLIESKQ